MKQTPKSKRKGFTLIELLIVIAIIGVLASIIILAMTESRNKARIAKNSSHLDMIHTAIEGYHAQNGSYPVSSGWQGYCSAWGASLGGNWIPELVSGGIIQNTTLPVDVRQEGSVACVNNQEQIIYYSNGANYKLITVMHPDVSGVPPSLVDPTRPTTAYGFWSPGGVSF